MAQNSKIPSPPKTSRPCTSSEVGARNYGIQDALNDMEVSIGQARNAIDSLQQKIQPITRPTPVNDGPGIARPAEGTEVVNRIKLLQTAIDNLTITIDTITANALI